MPDTDHHSELRELQSLAYGRDGALSADQARRLRELETMTSGPAVDDAPSGAAVAPAPTVAAVVEQRTDPQPAATDPAIPGEEGSGATAAVRGMLPRHWMLIAAVFLAAILAGLGAGWMLFAQRGPSGIELDAQQREWQNAVVADGDYDDGSVVAIGQEDGAVIWFATRQGGEKVCVIIGDGESIVPSCSPRDFAATEGLYVSLSHEVDGQDREINAQVLLTSSGDPAVSASSYSSTSTQITYATEEQTRIAGLLADAGYDPTSLWVVGFDGDTPIWTATETESQQQCLIYDGSAPEIEESCVDSEDLWEVGGFVELAHVDQETGETTTFRLTSGMGPSYLEITRNADATGS